MPQHFTTYDRNLYFPSEKWRAAYFSLPQMFIIKAGFVPANLGSNGKHANHYTIEATKQSNANHACYTNKTNTYL
jgi:hypothetical protein